MRIFAFTTEPVTLAMPLFLDKCPAGFPSPATDFQESELDLNDYCVSHPSATFFVRASGNSMTDIGLKDGDLMVVDRSVKPVHGHVVIAEVDGEFTVKQLRLSSTPPHVTLQPMNPDYPAIHPDPERLQIFGVVRYFIHKLEA